MSLTVVGSVAFDALETPFGKRDKILGGAATHFSLSASFFTKVNAVGVVGGDFGEAEWDVFKRHAINTDDVEVVPDGKTFFWSGRYDYDMNTAHTLDTQLNVFETFDPKLSDNSKAPSCSFSPTSCRCCKNRSASNARRRICRDGHDEFLDLVDEGRR